MKVIDIKTKRIVPKQIIPKLKIDVTNFPVVSVIEPPYDEDFDGVLSAFSQLMRGANAHKPDWFQNIYTFVEYEEVEPSDVRLIDGMEKYTSEKVLI